MIKSDLVNLINAYGDVCIDTEKAMESILNGDSIDGVTVTDESEVDQYNKTVDLVDYENPMTLNKPKEYKYDPDTHLKALSKHWDIPSEYLYMDIVTYLINKCKTDDEKHRVALELTEFEKRKEINVLKLMVYIVDKFRENSVVWGVGRGSSVSCFCLYLIGINKINPMVYDIPYTEFFKD